MRKQRGSLTVVSGFSGAGKGTIMKALLARYDNYCLSVSCTTRQPRPGEQDGREYFFKTQEEFDRMVEEDALLEHAGYVGHSYGTPRAFVEQKIQEGKDVILEIEVQGAKIIKQKVPEAILLFVSTPSAKVLEERLRGRGTESDDTVRERLAQTLRESGEIAHYDCLIVNDDLDEAVEEVHHAIQTLKHTPDRERAFIETLQEELRAMNAPKKS
ncbi:MAG: guanylate kinase [Lachnospiraceae bacterium]|jgi:guanylate kinase|nr:guanylate kinase [Lachnospiraceae bacterium]MCI1397578.1 guanylate kinase [Lachnospiraceae bacterium]MCI1423450.1 guanylate kinase [Lachnospiraceae bacterium]MCI1451895.1 guanylate kinase [Lachnospiraceae bacterium]